MSALPVPRDIDPKRKAYAFERSLGIPPAEACRRAGGKVDNGHATKWERAPAVQKWIAYYRSLGQTEEMLAAKRQRIEERLNLAAYGDLLEFAELVDEMEWDAETAGWRPSGRKTVMIDWAKVMASPLRVIISEFAFHKDTGKLVSFKRDSAENAANQLRDMHGFKSVNKTALTDPSGEKPGELIVTDSARIKALEQLIARSASPAA